MYKYERVGRIFVDSGQIAVGDPCYTLGHPEDIGDGHLKLVRNDDGIGWKSDENGNTVIEVDETKSPEVVDDDEAVIGVESRVDDNEDVSTNVNADNLLSCPCM